MKFENFVRSEGTQLGHYLANCTIGISQKNVSILKINICKVRNCLHDYYWNYLNFYHITKHICSMY